jgi:rhodanese-related sulfurtransferase/DNA-binding transcriptional ArsR family regulator
MRNARAKRHPAKDQLLEQFARIGKAVSSPIRLELLDLLAQGEKPVDLIARQAGLSVTNASNHLKVLRSAALVQARKEGSFVHYRLADASVLALVRSLQETARRRLADVRQIVADYFDEPESLPPVAADDLLDLMRSEGVVALDVRPPDEFAAGHIPGALSIPLEELERRLDELPRKREIVAYCRGPYCVLALGAVEILRGRGIRARRLEVGLPDWSARGFAVAT